MKITTVDVTGTVVIVAELVATNCSTNIARPANVWTRQRQVPRKNAAESARPRNGKVTNAATTTITTAVVAGTAVTAVERLATNFSYHIAQNVFAKIPRKRRKSVRRAENVVSNSTWVMAVATMKTTTAAATGTVVTAVGRVTTNTNTRTARCASV